MCIKWESFLSIKCGVDKKIEKKCPRRSRVMMNYIG